jgi:hypothetical protein
MCLFEPVRTTAFAPAVAESKEQPSTRGYGKPTVAAAFKMGRFVFAGLHPPARWHAAPSCPSDPFGPPTTQGSRRQPAAGGCRQHSQLSTLSAARAVSMEWRGNGKTAPGQREARIQWRSARCRFSGGIGVEGIIGGPASSSCATKGWRSRCRRQRPRSPFLPHRFPGLSGPILGSTGKSGWLAMRRLSPLDRSRSSSLASQDILPLRSVWSARKMELLVPCLFLGQVCLSERKPLLSFPVGSPLFSSLRNIQSKHRRAQPIVWR